MKGWKQPKVGRGRTQVVPPLWAGSCSWQLCKGQRDSETDSSRSKLRHSGENGGPDGYVPKVALGHLEEEAPVGES